jgi:hypothetical protein
MHRAHERVNNLHAVSLQKAGHLRLHDSHLKYKSNRSSAREEANGRDKGDSAVRGTAELRGERHTGEEQTRERGFGRGDTT